MFRSVALALKKARYSQEVRWLEIRQQHTEHWRIAQQLAQLADFTTRESQLQTSNILDRLDTLSEQIKASFRVSTEWDPNHLVCRALGDVRDAVLESLRCVAQSRPVSPIEATHQTMEEVCLEEAINRICKKLSIGIIFRRLDLEWPKEDSHFVRTFRGELEMVIEELIFTAIEVSPEGAALRFQVACDPTGRRLDVHVDDQGTPIEALALERILGNEPTADTTQPRWALSLAQRMAHSIGAGITANRIDFGNRVTLQVPVLEP
jgi:signal transduction histidine kinase